MREAKFTPTSRVGSKNGSRMVCSLDPKQIKDDDDDDDGERTFVHTRTQDNARSLKQKAFFWR